MYKTKIYIYSVNFSMEAKGKEKKKKKKKTVYFISCKRRLLIGYYAISNLN